MTNHPNRSRVSIDVNGDIIIRTRAFDGVLAPAYCQVQIDDGHVLVYDPIAGYYTSCHSMPDHDQELVRAAARRAGFLTVPV